MVSDQIVGTAPLAPLAPLAPMRSHRAPPLRLTNKPVSPPARTVCASVGWATSACMRLLSGNGARCRIHDFPASGLCHTPQPAVPRHILYSAAIRCPLRLGPCVTPQATKHCTLADAPTTNGSGTRPSCVQQIQG